MFNGWKASFQLRSAILCCAFLASVARGQPGVPPPFFSDPKEAMEFARRNLPPGVRPGDILRDQPHYPSGDVAAVYRTVLDVLYDVRGATPRLVVLNEVADGRVVACGKALCPFIPTHKSRIDTLTLQSFRRATLTRRLIRRDFKYRLRLTLLTESGRAALPGIGQRRVTGSSGTGMTERPFWIGFMSAYPGAWGLATVTQVGFNPARNQALLQVRHSCGTYCSSTEIMFLRKSKGRWRVAERLPESSDSTDLGHQYLRFRGVGAGRPAVEMKAKQVSDSVRRMSVPRAIRGVLRDAGSGSSIAHARVSLHAGNTPNTPWDQVYSDSAGRYVFINPPVGGAGIMVYCPKSTARPGEILGVAGTDVEPGTDITVDLTLESQRCDEAAPPESRIRPPG